MKCITRTFLKTKVGGGGSRVLVTQESRYERNLNLITQKYIPED